ncbi:hypothetical protein ACWC9T_33520 [Kitasatospora sp. NPDC001159]
MSTAQVTDLYEVTMAHSCLPEQMTAPATFELFVRPRRGFLVAAGLQPVLDFLTEPQVDEEDVAVFATTLGRPYRELEPLLGLRFTSQVWARTQGADRARRGAGPEVTAPLPEAQLVESFPLNQVCHQTAVASKAARCVIAAAGRPVVDVPCAATIGVPTADQGLHHREGGQAEDFKSSETVVTL